MILLQPIWVLLAIPLGASLWVWRLPSRSLTILRLATLLLVLLALSGLSLRLPSRAGTVVVVADRSQSMPPGSEVSEKEAINLIQAAMSANDRLAVVSFGQAVAVEQPPQTGKFAGFLNEVGRDASNLAEGVETALGLIPTDTPGKVLVISDGRWTGRDPAIIASRAAARGVAIDYRLLQRAPANDLAIARIDAPTSVSAGESFMISAWVQSPISQEIGFEFKRGTQVLSSGRRQVTSGLNRFTFRDKAIEPGTQAYALNVSGNGDDPVPENNTARILVGISGPRPLLHVTAAGRPGLPRLLEAGGLKVKVAAPEACDWTLEGLSKYSAVLIENLAAEQIGEAGMENLAAWVRETGSGLMMTGGRSSYAPGGYYRSPLEPILPVSIELRNEHRKLSLAIVVTLDRSGSMAMPIGGGRRKMDLANLGTVQVLDLLGPMDEFGVIAVDTEPHIIAPLAPAKDKERVRRDVLRIESMGGGIYVYVALEAALRMILPAKAGTRHIILFADAADAEEPGKYEELIDRCQKANITVSVIGLGTPMDKDAELLRDIAKRGKGRIFFSDKPDELPRLFAQDTFVVARSTFLDEITSVQATPALSTLTGKAFDITQPIGGYNLCYLRPGATLGTVSVDEYKAPVVAAWQAGLGRVLCYTGEIDGKYTGRIARWPEVGAFFTSLARWTTGQTGPLPEHMLLTQEVKNGINVVQLHLDPERIADPFSQVPRVTTLHGVAGQGPQVRKNSMKWVGADSLAATITLEGTQASLTTVDIPGHGPVSLPPVCLPYSPEFRPANRDVGLLTLDRLARSTAGKERVELAGIWKDLPKHPRMISIAPWLINTALAVLLLEVLERRTGLIARRKRLQWRTSGEVVPRRLRESRQTKPAVAALSAPAPALTTQPFIDTETPAPAAADKAGMLDALREARQRSRGRTDH
jgi:Mg-chelatase subunit ChlD